MQGHISIQAAFRSEDWTLLFMDHNVMITFHIMGLRNSCKREDLEPGSQVSFFIILFIFFFNLKLLIAQAMGSYLEPHSWSKSCL